MRLNWGMIGGGEGSQIGPAHRIAAGMDGLFTFAAGALDVDPAKGRDYAQRLGVAVDRAYGNWQGGVILIPRGQGFITRLRLIARARCRLQGFAQRPHLGPGGDSPPPRRHDALGHRRRHRAQALRRQAGPFKPAARQKRHLGIGGLNPRLNLLYGVRCQIQIALGRFQNLFGSRLFNAQNLRSRKKPIPAQPDRAGRQSLAPLQPDRLDIGLDSIAPCG